MFEKIADKVMEGTKILMGCCAGIMTFIVSQQGCVYQKDLGPKTSKLAAGMKEYDPDTSWSRSPD